MADVYGKIQLAAKNQAWHTANATLVVELGRKIYLSGISPMMCKVGDGVTQLSSLPWETTQWLLTGYAGPSLIISSTDRILVALEKLESAIINKSILMLCSENGHWWKFAVGDDGVLPQPGQDMGIISSLNPTYFILKSIGGDGHWWKFKVGNDGILSQPGEDLGVIYGSAPFCILRSTGDAAHLWNFYVGDDGVLSQPGQDLGV